MNNDCTHTQLQRYTTLESGEKIPQQSLSNKDKGYLCQHNSYNLVLVTLTAGIVLGIVVLAIVKMYQVSKIEDEFGKKMNWSIIISIGITAFVWNIIEIVLNIIVLDIFVRIQRRASPGSDSSLLDQHTATKWLAIIGSIVIFIITAIITGIITWATKLNYLLSLSAASNLNGSIQSLLQAFLLSS